MQAALNSAYSVMSKIDKQSLKVILQTVKYSNWVLVISLDISSADFYHRTMDY